jgi:beta-glucosidase
MFSDGYADQFGGFENVEAIVEAFDLVAESLGEEGMLDRLADSARRVLRNHFLLGLFDNPYLCLEHALAVVNSDEAAAAGLSAFQQTVVMLKNNGVIAENWAGDRPLVYVPLMYNRAVPGNPWMPGTPASAVLPVSLSALNQFFDVITDTVGDPSGPEDAEGNPTLLFEDIIRATPEELADIDFALVFSRSPQNAEGGFMWGWYHGYDTERNVYVPVSLQYRPYRAINDYVRDPSVSGFATIREVAGPYGLQVFVEHENRSYFGELSNVVNEFELDAILSVSGAVPEDAPVIVAMNAVSPMIFSEFEEFVDVILVGFDIPNEIFLDIVAGNIEPSGLLPVQMPADMLAVERQLEDVPRDMEVFIDSMGNAYDFAFGLNWSGVIDDWRTERFNVPPLVSPEREPVHRPEGITR